MQIDSSRFSLEHGELSGRYLVSDLCRLHDQLADQSGEMTWQLHGDVDALARPVLHLKLDGHLRLVCQRCLQSFEWRLATQNALVQFADEAKLDEAQTQDEDLDAILIDPALDVMALIEDEVLLSLPFAPMHDVCEGIDGVVSAGTKANPFAVLAGLKAGKAS